MIKWIKNIIGRCLGYGTCPNCNSTWFNLKHESIKYDMYNGVIICHKCFYNRKTINSKKIFDCLMATGWSVEDALCAAEHVKKYKETGKNIFTYGQFKVEMMTNNEIKITPKF